MKTMNSYFEEHPDQYFSGVAAMSFGILAYAGAKVAKAVIESQPVEDKDKGLFALGVSGLTLAVTGLATEHARRQENWGE